MSQELYIFLNRSEMPSPDQWQQAISRSGFDLRLDTIFDPLTFTGFVPCHLAERETGFGYYFGPREEVATPDTYLAQPTRSFDSVVTFIWGGGLTELSAVMMAAGSLASQTPSLLHNPEDDSSVGSVNALGYVREQLSSVQQYLK